MNDAPTILMTKSGSQIHPTDQMARLVEHYVGGVTVIVTTPEELQSLLTKPQSIDLVLMELGFDGGRGSHWLKELASPERQGQSRFPVVILAGEGVPGPGIEEEMLLLGASDVWQRDTPEALLAARLRTQLRRKWAADRLSNLTHERDEFAKTVLSAITDKKDAITHSSSALISYLTMLNQPFKSPEVLTEIERVFRELIAVGEELTSYAATVIQGRKSRS